MWQIAAVSEGTLPRFHLESLAPGPCAVARCAGPNVNNALYRGILTRFPACAITLCRTGTDMTRALPFALALLFALPAFAADKGDAAAGKTLVYTCVGCHGITGWKNAYPSYHVPKIGGQNYEYLVNALMEYKTGGRSHPTMRTQGEALSEQEIRDIATYLSSLTP